MIHLDWTAWDAWMEANDAYLAAGGPAPTCEEITWKNDHKNGGMTDRDRNISELNVFNRNVRNLENARLNN